MYILERIEGPLAVIEQSGDGEISFFELPLTELPENAAEGDRLVWQEGVWQLDRAAAEADRDAMAERLRKLGLL